RGPDPAGVEGLRPRSSRLAQDGPGAGHDVTIVAGLSVGRAEIKDYWDMKRQGVPDEDVANDLCGFRRRARDHGAGAEHQRRHGTAHSVSSLLSLIATRRRGRGTAPTAAPAGCYIRARRAVVRPTHPGAFSCWSPPPTRSKDTGSPNISASCAASRCVRAA